MNDSSISFSKIYEEKRLHIQQIISILASTKKQKLRWIAVYNFLKHGGGATKICCVKPLCL